MKEFNYKGIIFDAEFDTDSDTHSMILMEVFHLGENITECLNDDIILEMEESLNKQLKDEIDLAEYEAKY